MSDLDTVIEDRKFPPFAFGEEPDESQATFQNYEKVGQLIYEWATGDKPWPKDLADFRALVGDNLYVPAEYERLRIVQADNGSVQIEPGSNGLEFVLRLPPKGQVMESAERIDSGITSYPLPPLYELYLQQGHGRPPKGVFHARIADYTMRSCR